jgi:hypothetical protein
MFECPDPPATNTFQHAPRPHLNPSPLSKRSRSVSPPISANATHLDVITLHPHTAAFHVTARTSTLSFPTPHLLRLRSTAPPSYSPTPSPHRATVKGELGPRRLQRSDALACTRDRPRPWIWLRCRRRWPHTSRQRGHAPTRIRPGRGLPHHPGAGCQRAMATRKRSNGADVSPYPPLPTSHPVSKLSLPTRLCPRPTQSASPSSSRCLPPNAPF